MIGRRWSSVLEKVELWISSYCTYGYFKIDLIDFKVLATSPHFCNIILRYIFFSLPQHMDYLSESFFQIRPVVYEIGAL